MSVDTASSNILLTGKTLSGARGTLYAAYEFLKLQGCGWLMPGSVGEVVPQRQQLKIPSVQRIEVPDYDVRGAIYYNQQFFAEGGWIYIHADDFYDWCVRNRINASWFGAHRTYLFGDHRGGSLDGMFNHTWRFFLLDEHPEWWALVDGKRTKYHTSGRPTMLCVSNQKLRDYAVEYVLKFFEENPQAEVFAMNPEDEPTFWCECGPCMALDGDEIKELRRDTSTATAELDMFRSGWNPMADRTVNFVNEIAERVTQVYPDKFIELYAYGSFRKPPKREKVHPNIFLKYTHYETVLNSSLLDDSIERHKEAIDTINGWEKAGVKRFAIYDYSNWINKDVPNFWFYQNTALMRDLHEKWNIRDCLGEVHLAFPSSLVFANVKARSMWNTKIDYKQEIRNICSQFYGPAADAMTAYYMHMDDVLMTSEKWRSANYQKKGGLFQFHDYSLTDMKKGDKFLDKALQLVNGSSMIRQRIDYARLGHAIMTVVVVRNGQNNSSAAMAVGVEALERAKKLIAKYNITLSAEGPALLNTPFPPLVNKNIFPLPLQWQFKTDPNDAGLSESWQSETVDASWTAIATDASWTAQGYDYHGVAWYATDLAIPSDKAAEVKQGRPAILFGAIDGEADIFLDGVKIGEQKLNANVMWDRPFAILLPKSFDPAASHTLRVRVYKEAYAAGIWKPVTIVNLEK